MLHQDESQALLYHTEAELGIENQIMLFLDKRKIYKLPRYNQILQS